MEEPIEIKEYTNDYKDRAWEEYSIEELGNMIHLLAKKATHRSKDYKRKSDLKEARNYLAMIDTKLKELEEDPE